MSLAVRLDTREEIGYTEVGENVLDGWKFGGEGYFEGLVDLVDVTKRCEGGARKHVADVEGGVELAMFVNFCLRFKEHFQPATSVKEHFGIRL